MKKLMCLSAAIALALTLCACFSSDGDIQIPVKFYYCNSDDRISYNSETGVIGWEARESNGYQEDLTALIDLYLKGPVSDYLKSPFPSGVSVVNISQTETELQITLSNQFGTLTGCELSLACGCLSMTLLEYTDAQSVEIMIQDEALDEKASITMSWENLILLDDSTTFEDTEQ